MLTSDIRLCNIWFTVRVNDLFKKQLVHVTQFIFIQGLDKTKTKTLRLLKQQYATNVLGGPSAHDKPTRCCPPVPVSTSAYPIVGTLAQFCISKV